jgi:hypothetical protein
LRLACYPSTFHPILFASYYPTTRPALRTGEPWILIRIDDHSTPPVQTRPRQPGLGLEHAACQGEIGQRQVSLANAATVYSTRN